MILQAVFVYYGLPYFTNNAVKWQSVWLAAFSSLSPSTRAHIGGDRARRHSLVDPARPRPKAIGMTHWQTMTERDSAAGARSIMPQIGNNFINNLKDTSVMFIIGYTDFFATQKAVVGATFCIFPPQPSRWRVSVYDAG